VCARPLVIRVVSCSFMLRWLVTACALVVSLHVVDAGASVSIAVGWESLLHESVAAAMVSPLEVQSVWESARIYTYTRVRIDRVLAGELATGSEILVRTMGGVVGQTGQLVEGEAVLTRGEASLLFVHAIAGRPGTFDVTARGQGQFPLVADARTPPHLVRSNTMGALLPARVLGPVPGGPLAADVVHGHAVDDVAREVASAWSRTHTR
jgi:hypothetical protein